MAKRKSSPLEDFVELVAVLPWWVGILVALVLYVVLSNYAAQPAPPLTVAPGDVPNITPRILMVLAGVLQYVIPLLALIGALLSLLKHSKRTNLIEAAAAGGQNVLDGISWQEFELLVGEAFRRKGYTLEESGGGVADGGVDLILWKDGEKALVQCKQWRAYKVGVKVVRELYGVMTAEGASAGYVVTSGRFTRGALEFAKGREIELIEGEQLTRMIREVKNQRKPLQNQSHQKVDGLVLGTEIPKCPRCGEQMVKRVARRGENAGKQFWGCKSFPECRGVRAL